ncbi:MAG: UvrD-helicase domain-containing protein [Bacteroidetes bacterium]|nr:UvrD-helicase domain-containing protein [Bacteroidota bacterium]
MQNFTVYKSSAGSGKTFTLVKEYLKLALADEADPPQVYKHILAVTFTNKAAAEMKQRIISALKELSHAQSGKPSAMAQALGSELLLDPFTLADRAQRVLKAILHNYTDFAIGTIDAFVHRIVRAFAFDLHLPVNFEVETDADKLLRQAVDLLIGRIGSDEQLTEVLVQFAEAKTEEDRNWQIEQELLTTARHLLGEEGAAKAERLRNLSLNDFLGFRDTLRKSTEAFKTLIKQTAAKGVQHIELSGIPVSAFYHGSSGVPKWFDDLAQGTLEKLADYSSYVKHSFEEDKWYSAKTPAAQKAAIDELKPQLSELYAKLLALRDKHYGTYLIHTLLLKNIYAIAALNEIEKLIFSFRADQNIVHISEFNRIISKIVFAEPVPFIYERLGERYTNYLIDEFQDTSVLQWQNLLPLIDNALGGGNFTMLVGDGKQAIYRWRGGEVEQFARLPYVKQDAENEIIADRQQSLIRNYRGLQLARNFRSKTEIVQFNNALFRLLAQDLTAGYQDIYDKLEQESDTANTGGSVCIERLVPEKGDDEKELHVQRTLEKVHELRAQGWELQDIAILTRTNNEGSRIAAALLDAGYPVISSESLLISRSPAVGFVLAVLRIIELPSDAIARTQMLGFLVNTGRIHGTLHSLLEEAAKDGLAALLQKHNLIFNELVLARMPLYQRCEEIIRRFRLDNEPDAYLLFFLDEVLSFGMGRGNNPADFLNWWTDRSYKASVVVPEGMNAVRVMTIHKSKGLEFPVVIFPFANWKFETSRKDLWIDLDDEALPGLETAVVSVNESLLHTSYAAQYEEERNKSLLDHLNVLYVALTRPEHRLYVFTGRSGKDAGTELKTASDCFARFLTATGEDAEETVYLLGEETPPSGQQRRPGEFLNTGAAKVTDWTERISIRSHARELWTDEKEQPGDKHKLLRLLLSHCRTADDVQDAARRLVLEGVAEDTQAFLLAHEATQLIRQPALQPFFDAASPISSNAELLLPASGSIKIDRVTDTGEKLLLLNFVTGMPAKPRREILLAAAALEKKKKTEAWLYFLQDGKLCKATEV